MAESFNTFFATAALNVVNKINPSNKSATDNIPNNVNVFSLNNSLVTISEILEATKALQDKKKPDHNGISSNFIKKIIFNIAQMPTLYIIFSDYLLNMAWYQLNLK